MIDLPRSNRTLGGCRMALFFCAFPIQNTCACDSISAAENKDINKEILQRVLPKREAMPQDIEDNRLMAAISYVGLLCLIPYLMARRSAFVQWHALQGLRLFLISRVYFLFTVVIELLVGRIALQAGLVLSAVSLLIGLIFPLLAIVGLRAALRGKKQRLPIIEWCVHI